MLFLGLLISSEIFAQAFYDWRRDRKLLGSFGFGTASYFGDLKDGNEPDFHFSNISVSLLYNFYDRFSVRGQLQWYQLEGDDAETDNATNRNLSFRANNFEFNVVGVVNILPQFGAYYERQLVEPYVFGGVGLSTNTPKAKLNGEWHSLRPLETEGNSYSAVVPVFPFGGGVRFKINYIMNITIEGGFRLTTTDYLDDVSTTYIDNSSFEDPIAAALADRRPEVGFPLHEAGDKRGDPSNNDNYFIALIKVDVFLPRDVFRIGGDRGRRPRTKIFRKFKKTRWGD